MLTLFIRNSEGNDFTLHVSHNTLFSVFRDLVIEQVGIARSFKLMYEGKEVDNALTVFEVGIIDFELVFIDQWKVDISIELDINADKNLQMKVDGFNTWNNVANQIAYNLGIDVKNIIIEPEYFRTERIMKNKICQDALRATKVLSLQYKPVKVVLMKKQLKL
jgi:hypothetical protein